MTQTVLVTGASGFIGSQLCRTYARQGVHVRAVGLIKTDAERTRAESMRADPTIDFHELSVTDPRPLSELIGGVDVVLHLSAAQHEAGMPASHFHRVNVDGTRHVFEAAIAHGVRRVVHASTIGVYQPQELVTLDSPLGSDHHYGRTKLEAERMIEREFMDQIETVVVRISEAYGPEDYRLLKMFRAIETGKWLHIGPGLNPHHPIYIDDLVEHLQAAAQVQQAKGQTFVAAGPHTVTSREMAEQVADALGAPRPTRTLPLGPMKLAAVVMETLSRPIHLTPPLHRRRLDFFVRGFDFDISRTRELLAIQPQIDFAEGARLTADWYRQAGLLRETPHRPPLECPPVRFSA